MRGLKKSQKRVSWSSEKNLCQVRLFLSDESPSQVGLGGQDHLQAKAWHSAGSENDNLPPGFEGMQPENLFQNKLSQVPLIQWKFPSRFVLDPNWQVAAGEESKEMEFESKREMRVLEAVYPRPSAIPPNPASPMGPVESYYNDQHTPLIPITPIEDEDDSSSSINTGNLNGTVEPDAVTAAYSALNAAMSNTSQGSLIDPNLLIEFLSNPTLIEQLVSNHLPSTSGPPTTTTTTTLPPEPTPAVQPRPTHLPFSTPSSSSGGSHYPMPPPRTVPVPAPPTNLAPPLPPAVVNAPAKKDPSYYKSLIQQHGGEKVEGMNNNNNNNNNNVKIKGKIMKPCIYFNSARGCRHGANCVFQHDSSSSQQRTSSMVDAQSAKRMKMDSREISGT